MIYKTIKNSLLDHISHICASKDNAIKRKVSYSTEDEPPRSYIRIAYDLRIFPREIVIYFKDQHIEIETINTPIEDANNHWSSSYSNHESIDYSDPGLLDRLNELLG